MKLSIQNSILIALLITAPDVGVGAGANLYTSRDCSGSFTFKDFRRPPNNQEIESCVKISAQSAKFVGGGCSRESIPHNIRPYENLPLVLDSENSDQFNLISGFLYG